MHARAANRPHRWNTSLHVTRPALLGTHSHELAEHGDQRQQVIDEADKLLNQSFQDWLAKVLAAVQRPYNLYLPLVTSGQEIYPLEDPPAGGCTTTPIVLRGLQSEFRTDYDEPRHSSCQKLLFSATLTSDPGKIASLGLRDPKYFIVRENVTGATGSHHAVSENFSMPTNLTVSFHSVPPLGDFYRRRRKGTYDRMRSLPETPNTLLSRARLPSRQCASVHEISGVYHAPRQTFRVV